MRQLTRGDLLALIDRAAPVVGEVQEDSDPIAPGMLFTDACVLLDQLARRTTGKPVSALVRWQSPVTAARDMSAVAQPVRRSTPVRGAQKAGRDKGQAEHPHARPAVNARLPTPLLGLAVVYLLSASIV